MSQFRTRQEMGDGTSVLYIFLAGRFETEDDCEQFRRAINEGVKEHCSLAVGLSGLESLSPMAVANIDLLVRLMLSERQTLITFFGTSPEIKERLSKVSVVFHETRDAARSYLLRAA